jgi:hypothetical protein
MQVVYMLVVHLPFHYYNTLQQTEPWGILALVSFSIGSVCIDPVVVLKRSLFSRRVALWLVIGHTIANMESG